MNEKVYQLISDSLFFIFLYVYLLHKIDQNLKLVYLLFHHPIIIYHMIHYIISLVLQPCLSKMK